MLMICCYLQGALLKTNFPRCFMKYQPLLVNKAVLLRTVIYIKRFAQFE